MTFTGVLSRIIGFFYRIFLSRTIGAEGLGIYQLIFPVLTLCISLSAAGIQTSISKFVAEEQGKGGKYAGIRYLYAGLFFSLTISLFICAILLTQADLLAVHMLNESRCTELIRIMAYSLPFAAIHSCINGYYYGLKKTAVPSISQLVEQLVRVGTVYLIYLISQEQGVSITPLAAVWGLVIGGYRRHIVLCDGSGLSWQEPLPLAVCPGHKKERQLSRRNKKTRSLLYSVDSKPCHDQFVFQRGIHPDSRKAADVRL